MTYTEKDIREAFRSVLNMPISENELIDYLKSQEHPKDELFLWDGINCSLEEIDSMDDAKEYIKENFIEDGEIHNDIEGIFILKKVASVYLEETPYSGVNNDKNFYIVKLKIE